MIENGRIAKVGEKQIDVVFMRNSACAKCGKCGMAGDAKEAILTLDRPEGLLQPSIGDIVSVKLPERRVVGASLLAYGVPLIALIAGAALGPVVGSSLEWSGTADAASLVGGLILVVGGVAAVRCLNPRIARKGFFSPRIVAITPSTASGCDADR